MKEARHDESRVYFQLERLIFFTDAVFAIAITLLVIEIKVPVLKVFSDHELLEQLGETYLKFFGFLISFGIIGHYWAVHHRIFGYAKKYTSSLFWLNLAFLFSIVTIPFTSGLVGEYSSHTEMNVPYVIYSINMIVTGLLNCWLWLFISNPKRDLLTRKISPSRIKLGLYRSLVFPSVFLLSLLVSYFFPVLCKALLLLIPATLHFGLKGLEATSDKQEGVEQ